MALEGNLEEFNIVAVLQMLASGGMTGTLTVQDGSTQNLVSFAEGCVVQAYSTLQEDQLGEILVRTHRLARPQLEQATQQLRLRPGQALGPALAAAKLIARPDLVMAVQIQILEIMSKLLLWSRGQWRFDFNPPDPNGVTPAEGMSVDEILSGQMLLLDTLEPQYDGNDLLEPEISEPAPASPVVETHAVPAPPAMPGPPPSDNPTVVVSAASLERINNVMSGLLTRTEAHEACLIDSSGSLITRRGTEVHRTYPTLFALVAGIFASWQELGRSLGESKASTLLYQGGALNICLTPVGAKALLMTIYQSASDSGLVNFWNREASGRILRLLAEVPPNGSNLAGTPGSGVRPPDPNLPTNYQSDAEQAMNTLLRSK